MKYLILAFAGLAFSSCNKQYTCECKVTGGTTNDFVVSATKQNDAASKCATYSSNSAGSAPTSCALK